MSITLRLHFVSYEANVSCVKCESLKSKEVKDQSRLKIMENFKLTYVSVFYDNSFPTTIRFVYWKIM